MTRHPAIFAALAAEFGPDQVRHRSQGGRDLSYITARTAMNRLDEVLGPENWRDEFTETESGLRCRIWFRIPGTVEWSWKEDGGAAAKMAEADNDEKSAYSDAFKRSAVKLGVARYLYRDGVPTYYVEAGAGEVPHAPAAGPPPAEKPRGAWGGPRGDDRRPRDRPSTAARSSTPRNGRALFAWTKDQEQRHRVELLKYVNAWAKANEFPGRMVDWDEEQVGLALAELERKIAAFAARDGEPGDAYEEPLQS